MQVLGKDDMMSFDQIEYIMDHQHFLLFAHIAAPRENPSLHLYTCEKENKIKATTKV